VSSARSVLQFQRQHLRRHRSQPGGHAQAQGGRSPRHPQFARPLRRRNSQRRGDEGTARDQPQPDGGAIEEALVVGGGLSRSKPHR